MKLEKTNPENPVNIARKHKTKQDRLTYTSSNLGPRLFDIVMENGRA